MAYPAWSDLFQKYISVCDAREPGHSCHNLAQGLNEEEENFDRDIGYLNDYYANIERFLKLVNTAKVNPKDSTVLKALQDIQAELLDKENTLIPYFWGYVGALRGLNSIAKEIQKYIYALPHDATLNDPVLLATMLDRVKSTSGKVREDWEAEVGGGVDGFFDYVRNRPQKLFALGGIPSAPQGGMPPLPSKPGT